MGGTKIKLSSNLLSVSVTEPGPLVESNLHGVTVFDVLSIIDQISISCGLEGEMEEIKSTTHVKRGGEKNMCNSIYQTI